MNEPPRFHDSLGFLLTDLARLMRRRFQERAAAVGLTASQWRLVSQLRRAGSLPQARLAELLDIEPISVSRLVNRMEEAGWVHREADPDDRRVKRIVLSRKGHDAFDDASAAAHELYDETLAGLPPGTRDMLITTLRQMIRNLARNEDPGNAG